jgi:hypothetical protein
LSPRRPPARGFTRGQRLTLLSLGTLVSVACSFSTDGITFVPDAEFDAAGGTSRAGTAGRGGGSGGKAAAGAHPGGTSSDAGSDNAGQAGDESAGMAGVAEGGTAGLSAGGAAGRSGGGGKGGALNVAGSGVGGGVGIGGRPNSAGAPGTGGGGGLGPSGTIYPCVGDTPSTKVIADFEGIMELGQQWRGGQLGKTLLSVFGSPDPAKGKPNVKLGADDLTVEAAVGLSPVGAGIRISPCLNLKEAVAINFTMWGSTSSGVIPMIALRIYTNQNLLANDMTREGMCVPLAQQDPVTSCQPAHVDFPLPATPTELAFKFREFKGGQPSDGLELDQIKMIEWWFTSGLGQKPYDGTFSIDDVLLSY